MSVCETQTALLKKTAQDRKIVSLWQKLNAENTGS